MALRLEGVGDLARHVGFVVAGQNGVGPEQASGIERPFGDDPLTLAEQVRQYALVAHGDRAPRVHDDEADLLVLAALDRALLHKAAEAEARAGLDALRLHVGRGVKNTIE